MALSIVTIVNDAKNVLRVWKRNLDFKVKGVAPSDLEDDITQIEALNEQIAAAQQALTRLINDRSDRVKRVRKNATRARAGMKSYFGPDSSEYEEAGGTRESER